MPRRKQRPPPEVAVSASPFFRLPLELRTSIYELLLVQDWGLDISYSRFQRLRKPINSLTFRDRLWDRRYKPRLSIDILRVCRLIYEETLPIIYAKNVFCFCEAQAAIEFSRNCNHTRLIKQINLQMDTIPTFVHDISWKDYVKQKRDGSLTQDFPCLKRIVFDAGHPR